MTRPWLILPIDGGDWVRTDDLTRGFDFFDGVGDDDFVRFVDYWSNWNVDK